MPSTVAPLDAFQQTPDERLVHTIDFSEWLAQGETLSTASWEVDNATTPPLIAEDLAIVGTGVMFWVSGGVHLQKYTLVIEVETSASNTKQAALIFRIKDFTP